MKRMQSILAIIFLLGILSLPHSVSAFHDSLTDQGSWQVISNKYQKKTSVVQFYNHKLELVYEERLEGMKLNLRDRRTITLFNELLSKTIAFQNSNKISAETRLIFLALKNQRKKTTS